MLLGPSTADTLYAEDPATGACEAMAASSSPPTYLRLGQVLDASELPDLKPTIREE